MRLVFAVVSVAAIIGLPMLANSAPLPRMTPAQWAPPGCERCPFGCSNLGGRWICKCKLVGTC